jgi:hypothetical protein
MHTIRELLCLRKVGQLRLHPYHIAVRCVGDGAIDSTLTATLVPVVPFSRSRCLPVEVHVHTRQTCSNGTGLGVTITLTLLQELVDHILLVDVYTGVDRVDDGFVVEFQVGLFRPCIFDGLELCTVLSSLFSGVHEFA